MDSSSDSGGAEPLPQRIALGKADQHIKKMIASGNDAPAISGNPASPHRNGKQCACRRAASPQGA